MTRPDPVTTTQKTLAYADIFDYPLTKKEIEKWLVKGDSLTGDLANGQVGTAKLEGVTLMKFIQKTKSYYHLPNRSHLVKLRLQRQQFSQLKLKKAKKIAKLLSFIPSVKLIAVTGALAMNNSNQNDDIDLMIITKTNRLWLTRPILILILELLRRRRRSTDQGRKRSVLEGTPLRPDLKGLESDRSIGPENASSEPCILTDKICLNLFLDESTLAIPKPRHNLYTAHEVCQIKPLINKTQTYQKFLHQNSWVKNYLPNAIKGPKKSVLEGTPLRLDLEGLESDRSIGPENDNSEPLALQTHHFQGDPASGRVGTAKPEGLSLMGFLNLLAFKLQYAYMKSKITNEKVNLHSAFFHPRPTSKIVLKEYKARVRTILNRRLGQRLQKSRLRSVLEGTPLRPDLEGLESDRSIGPENASSKPSQLTTLITGCFDILHQEHKKFLTTAKKLGGKLVVGLETDTRIRKLKGSDRPINSINQRIKNLKKWGIADQVFALPKKFSSPADHLALLQSIKPDILAVSTHTPNLPAKRKLMKSVGGTVKVILPHNPQLSTTKIFRGS